MSIFRSDALELSFLDEIFTDDFPELPSILMQVEDPDFSIEQNEEEPFDFMNHVNSNTLEAKKTKRKSRWSESEDSVILDLVEKYGHSWKYFTKFLPGRPADSIKSRYYSYLKKKYLPQPRKFLTQIKPTVPSFSMHMSDDNVVDSLLCNDDLETSSASSRSTSDLNIQQDNSKHSVLKRLYAKMSSLEKVLARTYLEIDRLQTTRKSQ
mmetsp:Transcript_28887/g.51511  ORF Transcript_28887/g.51511 Transcript_28887/m.51511 type:complete len:209 (+) Transcript_28887:2588-3214(+)